ncbi:MAG: NADH-quinone oxidoreductase subunit NuoK [Candidatus Bathyarchaeia archaeon]
MIEPRFVLVTAFVLYGVGVYCLTTRRDLIRLLIGLTILMDAPNLSFIFFSTMKASGLVDPLPQALVAMAIVIDGCVIVVGLGLTVRIYRKYGSIDIETLRRLRW